MNKKILFFGVLFFALFVVVGLGGCNKDKPADAPDDTPKPTDVKVTPEAVDKPEAIKTPEEAIKDIEAKDPALAEMVAKMFADAEKKAQKTCPIMGNAIKRDIFVEYQGKKVYFCCPPCKDKFNADPKKFLPKLPQFTK
jgi:YHS domain-containing protein